MESDVAYVDVFRTVVPEPPAVPLLAAGLLSLGGVGAARRLLGRCA